MPRRNAMHANALSQPIRTVRASLRSVKFLNLKNLVLMYGWQISNYVLSFLLLPYLARTLNTSGFGVYAYCVGVNAYLWIMIEWGFPVGGMREAATNRDDPVALEKTFWKIIYAKLLLIIPATALLAVLAINSAEGIRQVVFISGFMTIVGASVACDWFAQGIERLDRFVSISIAARVLVTVLTFFLIRDAEDAHLAAMLHGVFGLLGGVAGFGVILATFRYLPKRERVAEVYASVTANFSLFLAKSNSTLYVAAPPIVLGLLATTAEVGIYAGADKLARICAMIIGPASLVVMPRIFASMTESNEAAARISGQFLLVQLALTIPMTLGLFIFAPLIIQIVLGPGFEDSVLILRVLSPVPILIALSGALNNQFLVPLKLDRKLAALSLICAAIYVLMLTGFVTRFAAIGAGFALLAVEVLMICGALLIVLRADRAYLRDAWAGMRSFNPMKIIRTS